MDEESLPKRTDGAMETLDEPISDPSSSSNSQFFDLSSPRYPPPAYATSSTSSPVFPERIEQTITGRSQGSTIAGREKLPGRTILTLILMMLCVNMVFAFFLYNSRWNACVAQNHIPGLPDRIDPECVPNYVDCYFSIFSWLFTIAVSPLFLLCAKPLLK